MGASDVEEDERPVHRVHVSEFFIGRFPVTNDEYARFVQATGHPAPIVRGYPLIALGGREELFSESAAPYAWENGEPPAGHGSHPVVLVRYDDAVAYCRWMSEALSRTVRTTSVEMCGSGSPTGTAPIIMGLATCVTRAARRPATFGWFAAGRGSMTMWRCCGARTGTRCRPTRTR